MESRAGGISLGWVGGTGRRPCPTTAAGHGSGTGWDSGDGTRGGREPSPRLWWQGQTCWRNTWWRSAACASALRSPSAPTTGSGSSWNAAWPPPARPAVRCCPGGVRALHTRPTVRGRCLPCARWALGRETQRRSPLAGLPSDAYAQAPELGLQLSGENQALRDDNRTLRLQREHLSQGRAWPPASRVRVPEGAG